MYWSYRKTASFSGDELQQVSENLSPSRKEHIHRLQCQEDKIRSLAAEILAQQILLEQYGVTSAQLHRSPNGQPYLSGCALHLSISHSADMVACAVSQMPVGIDIERIRPINLRLCHHVCTEEEKLFVLGSPENPEDRLCEDPEILHRFFEVWTAKEAYFKKCGTGITNLKSVNILPLPRELHKIDDYILQIL